MKFNSTFDEFFHNASLGDYIIPIGNVEQARRYRFKLYAYKKRVRKEMPEGQLAQWMDEVMIKITPEGNLLGCPAGQDTELERLILASPSRGKMPAPSSLEERPSTYVNVKKKKDIPVLRTSIQEQAAVRASSLTSTAASTPSTPERDGPHVTVPDDEAYQADANMPAQAYGPGAGSVTPTTEITSEEDINLADLRNPGGLSNEEMKKLSGDELLALYKKYEQEG